MTDPWQPDHSEQLSEGGTWLLDLVSAVDYLQRGYRGGFTVWDALDEAIGHTLPTDADRDEAGSPVADPLRHTLSRFLDQPSAQPVAVMLQKAVRHWVTAMAQRCNNNGWWPHPQPRRSFPPPLIGLDDLPER